MDKYSGMNRVVSKVRANGEVVKKSRRKGSGLKTFAVQAAVAAALFGALFGAKAFGGSASDFAAKVKEAVCFDTVGYAVSLLTQDDTV